MVSLLFRCFYIFCFILCTSLCEANDILGCGGFVKSHAALDFSKIEIGLYTKSGSLKEKTDCAPTNGYYFLPLYEKGDYILKIHPPAGWSFEPKQVDLTIDGSTDPCSTAQDINFKFNGFGITGTVVTVGQLEGPADVTVTLSSPNSESRHTTTNTGGHFHFTPVHPDTYTLEATHPRWPVDPSKATVRVSEGTTVVPLGHLAVSGYDVTGTVLFGHNNQPVYGVYVLLYSKEENPKYRVEGCQTALLQGVPDAPICYSVTDQAGKFTFGVVPAGEYRLLALRKPPTSDLHTYNLKPDFVPFTVKHYSVFIDKAFQLEGMSVSGVVLTHTSGTPLANVRVWQAGAVVTQTDQHGRYTLNGLLPGKYQLQFEHEHCEINPISIMISDIGLVSVPKAMASKWKVCGSVEGDTNKVAMVKLTADDTHQLKVNCDDAGKWCTYLPSGVYIASVMVTEKEKQNGLLYYPVNKQISVGHGPVFDVKFSQVKATLSGNVQCLDPHVCENLPVTIRGLSAHGYHVGPPQVVHVKDGKYTLKDVVAGSVEVSVEGPLCWEKATHVVAISTSAATAPPFIHTGYQISVSSSHYTQMDYEYKDDKGSWSLISGVNEFCVKHIGKYKLRPRGCHNFQPEEAYIESSKNTPPEVLFRAISHEGVIIVYTPQLVDDIVLTIKCENKKPITQMLKGQRNQNGGYQYKHTLFIKEHEQCTITARSSTMLFSAEGSDMVQGSGHCAEALLIIRGRPALTIRGTIEPPVPGVMVTLKGGNQHLVIEANPDGSYMFGPLDASHTYKVTAEKESYVFGAPDQNGVIRGNKLAEIQVVVKDAADKQLLQGALVSVSADSFRRNVMTDDSGMVLFAGLSPANYYIKPLMKEYKFTPTHHIVALKDGQHEQVILEGTRVAWSAYGELSAITGVGLKGAMVLAKVANGAEGCFDEEAITEDGGIFRIRGLLPKCEYKVMLKQTPEMPQLNVFNVNPTIIKPVKGEDIVGVKMIVYTPMRRTELYVLVSTCKFEHYKTLRLKLYKEDNNNVLYNKVLNVPASSDDNPGVPVILPALPADNQSYVLKLESTLSRFTHNFEDITFYVNADGESKEIYLEFTPKLRAVEEELEQSSLLVLPLIGVIVLAIVYRQTLLNIAMMHIEQLINNYNMNKNNKPQLSRTQILDQAKIQNILNTVNSVGKKEKKKKVN